MDEQIERIGARLRETIRQACEGLVAGIDDELQAVKDANISRLQDYEDLQVQHKLTLESCERLKTENISLQIQVQELLVKDSAKKANNESDSIARTDNIRKQSSLRDISLNIRSLIDGNPELQALLDAQAADYKKLQAAHGLLLRKLKEHQDVIVQLQRERTNSAPLPASDEERLVYLKSIISPSKSNPSRLRGSSSRPIRASLPPTIRHTNLPSDIYQSAVDRPPSLNGTHEVLMLDSSCPTDPVSHGVEREAIETIATLPTSSNQEKTSSTDVLPTEPTSNDSSQPVFVSERPVKRRRTGHAEVSSNKAVKLEPISTEAENAEDINSIDLDSVPVPIIFPTTHSRRSRPSSSSVSFGILEPNTTTGKRHSEPPTVTKSTSFDTDQELPIGIIIKNEKGIPSVEESRNVFSIPPPSSGDSYFQSKSRRVALQPKPSNVPITISVEQSAKQIGSSLEKKRSDPIKTKRIETVYSPSSNLELNHKAPVSEKQGATRSNNIISDTAAKYQTPLQKKRGQTERRLRDRSVGELFLNDFILNPAMNQGFNQALGDISAGKASKRCLPDCSKPECCGNAFAAAVQSAGIASLQDLSTKEKDGLIESYLGFPVSTLGPLSSQGYQKLLGEAIGKQFAEKYGKYKQARANSPPGYWRTEFPTTQERDVDKKRAEQIEKEAIAERRREALREGGLWIFRDE